MHLRQVIVSGLGALLLAQAVEARDVLGVRTPKENFYVAVRGLVLAGTVVTGIEFYSNDATLFPEVVLAADAGRRRLPQVETTLRTVAEVAGQAGYVRIEFPAYEVLEDQYLWAIVRFPDHQTLEARGLGGGPGVGWREERILDGERSFFSVQENMSEFLPALDITLVTDHPVSKSRVLDDPDGQPTKFAVHRYLDLLGTVFDVSIPNQRQVTVDLYNVGGRRIMRLHEGILPRGVHRIIWSGTDQTGRRISNGIYLYRVRWGGVQLNGKVILLR